MQFDAIYEIFYRYISSSAREIASYSFSKDAYCFNAGQLHNFL